MVRRSNKNRLFQAIVDDKVARAPPSTMWTLGFSMEGRGRRDDRKEEVGDFVVLGDWGCGFGHKERVRITKEVEFELYYGKIVVTPVTRSTYRSTSLHL